MLLFWTISVDYSVNAGNENKNRSSNGLARLRESLWLSGISSKPEIWRFEVRFLLNSEIYLCLWLVTKRKSSFSANAIYKLISSILFFSPLQVVIIFLKKMDILLAKTPKDDVRDHVLPMVCKALETPTEQLQVQNAWSARKRNRLSRNGDWF